MTKFNVKGFMLRQEDTWPLLKKNTEALSSVFHRSLRVAGRKVILQHNPSRIRSTCASTGQSEILSRPCFLCPGQRPSGQMVHEWKNYAVLANPYPILPLHLTIAARSHTPQQIGAVMEDFLELAYYLEGFTVFYNGPRSGASAPDHLHFQAGMGDHLPFWEDPLVSSGMGKISSGLGEMEVFFSEGLRKFMMIQGYYPDQQSFYDLAGFARLLFQPEFLACHFQGSEDSGSFQEPEWNWLCRYVQGRWSLAIFPRRAHRPACFFQEDPAKRLISPGALDMGGLLIMPRKKDFNRLKAEEVAAVFQEVSPEEKDWNVFRDEFSQIR